MTSSKESRLKILFLSAAMFSAMGGPVLAPALPAIKEAYHQIPNIEFWTKGLVAISGLFAAIGALLFGWLSDHWGRKRVLTLSLVGWGLFGASGMLEQPFWTLLAGRAFLGLFLGGLLVANTAMIADSFDALMQRHMMGLQSAFSSCGVILGLLFCGAMAEIHWHWPFSLFLLAFLVLPIAINCDEPTRKQADETHSNKFPVSGSFVLTCFFGFITMAAFNVIPTQMPFFIKEKGFHSASHLGLLLTVLPISSGLTSRLYARLSKHFGLWNLFLFPGIVMLIGFIILSWSQNSLEIIIGFALIGMGVGSGMPHVNIAMAVIIPQHARGRAMGILTGCKFLGLFASPFLMQPVLAWYGYATSFIIAGFTLLASALILFSLGPALNKRNLAIQSTERR